MDKEQDEVAGKATAGRTLDEQIEAIRKTGINGVTPYLKVALLRGLGIPRPKPSAKNLIKFGCNMPFMHPRYVQDYFRLLNLLGVEYTYLEKEYCCGGVAQQHAATDSDRERAIKVGKEFMEMNLAMARNKGSDTIVYVCAHCAFNAKAYFPEQADRHIFSWDLIVGKLEAVPLKVRPTTVGYFQGCGGSRMSCLFSRQTRLDWARYRRLLNRIEGLTVADVARGVCSYVNPGRVIQEAMEKGMNAIVTPCHACHAHLSHAADGRVRVNYLSDILVPAVENGMAAQSPEAAARFLLTLDQRLREEI